MGSSDSAQFILPAVSLGALYLLFDAARHFGLQLNSMRLRVWTGDPEFISRSRWFHYSPQNFILLSSAVLQVSLVGSVTLTAISLLHLGTYRAALITFAGWATLSVVWKFALAFIHDDLAEAALRAIIGISRVFYYLFLPVLFPLVWMLNRRQIAKVEDEDDEEVTDEEVQAYIGVGEEEGILEAGEGRMIESIVQMGDRIARELMTPRVDMEAFDANQPIDALAKKFVESKYARIPIYEGNPDKIIGIVHIKDFFEAHMRGDATPVRDISRPAYFISETKNVSELLREFQLEHLQIAIVVDEYGGTAGLISIEDVIEEIVGEIADEHEDAEETIVEVGEGTYLVNGLFRVETLERRLGVDISGDGYETVAGFIFTQIGKVPKVGEKVTTKGLVFEVDRADRKRIYRVRITPDPALKVAEDMARA